MRGTVAICIWLDLAAEVKSGVTDAGLVGMRFNTIGVSDGISMGTDGMSYSLQSRDLIADSIETIMGAQWYDALIALPGCDKNMPGCLMAMGRLNRPAIMIYGGTIKPGSYKDQKLDIVSAFQCYGQFIAGQISEEERQQIVRRSCPGAGACGGDVHSKHYGDRDRSTRNVTSLLGQHSSRRSRQER